MERTYIQISFLKWALPFVILFKLTPLQNEIFRDFETGTYNLIIATKWAEDLEIPPASVVIRYVILLPCVCPS